MKERLPSIGPSMTAPAMTEAPKFLELNAIQGSLLLAKLEAVIAAIAHAGEKGRALENGVRTLLRSILPAEYGLSTGFVVYHTADGSRLSSQLDIIIYDALRSGPIVLLKPVTYSPWRPYTDTWK